LNICARGQSKNVNICQQSVDDVMKAMQLCTRMWQLETATGRALKQCSNAQTTRLASWREHEYAKFCSYNAGLVSCIICLTKEFCPGLVKCRMRSNIETSAPVLCVCDSCLTQLWGVELWIELFLLPQLNFLSIHGALPGTAAELWRMDSCTYF
jgi:hypothetical protein